MLIDDEHSVLPSVLPGVSDEAWNDFVNRMSTASSHVVSDANALGMFEMTPRRLADLGYVSRLKRAQSSKGRTIWVATFKRPMTSGAFLRSPRVQYRAFARSMRDYAARIAAGEIAKPVAMSLSSALAVLHRAGPHGLRGKLHGATAAFARSVEGLF